VVGPYGEATPNLETVIPWNRVFGDSLPANSEQFTRRSFLVNNFSGNIAGFEDGTAVSSPFSLSTPASSYLASYTSRPHFLTLRNYHASSWLYLEWASSTAKTNCEVIWACTGNETIIGTNDSLVAEFRFWGDQSPTSSSTYYAVRMVARASTYPAYPGHIEYWYGTGVTLALGNGTLVSTRPFQFGAVYHSVFNFFSGGAFSNDINLADGFSTGGAAVSVSGWPSSIKCARCYVPAATYAWLFIDSIRCY